MFFDGLVVFRRRGGHSNQTTKPTVCQQNKCPNYPTMV